MPLRRPWNELDRDVLRKLPDRYGVYEFGDEDGQVLEVGHGPLRDEIKEAISYRDDVRKVRYEITPTSEAARNKAREHKQRLAERS